MEVKANIKFCDGPTETAIPLYYPFFKRTAQKPQQQFTSQ